METCSRSGIMNLCSLIRTRDLCCFIFRVLSKLSGIAPGLLKKFRQHVHAHPSQKEPVLRTLSELPQDTLMDVFATLEIPDLVRAGSVCSSWRAAYTTLRDLGKYKLSQTPCLLYTSESAGESVACLYSLVEKRTYKLTLPAPPIRSRYLIGSSHGWLVTVDDRSEMHLVNPITGEQIALPSVTTIKNVRPIFNKFGVVQKYEYTKRSWRGDYLGKENLPPHKLREYLHYKAFVFPETSKGTYIVVLIHNPYEHLSFARVGDDRWTWLSPHHYDDCNYKDGLLYAIAKIGEVHAFDLSGPVVTMKTIIGMWQNIMCENMYLVLAPWGDLLNVLRTGVEEGHDADPATLVRNIGELQIYKVDSITKTRVEFKWLNDHVLFLGHNQSLCLSTKEYPSLKANHAYFTDNNALWTMGFKSNRRNIGVFDLEKNVRDELVSPQLWSNWPTPVWITPSLATMNMK
ncbi:unnamed protein product [Urochloa decumbens]|uniref:F-box domain-containing protein n=1 Tax=Urochloa decumbens TaxID=240449 RepID=A0ABC8VM88_9POAL